MKAKRQRQLKKQLHFVNKQMTNVIVEIQKKEISIKRSNVIVHAASNIVRSVVTEIVLNNNKP